MVLIKNLAQEFCHDSKSSKDNTSEGSTERSPSDVAQWSPQSHLTRFHSFTDVTNYIEAGLTSFDQVSGPISTKNLNLHGNHIRRIQGLQTKRWSGNLESLDLSANQISVIEGLESLTRLSCLSLAGNLLSFIGSGLPHLTRLSALDLSFNQLVSIQGISSLPSLHTLSLHGNQLAHSQDVIPELTSLPNLAVLSFRLGSGCVWTSYEVSICL